MYLLCILIGTRVPTQYFLLILYMCMRVLITSAFNEYLQVLWEYFECIQPFIHGYQFLDYINCSNINKTTVKHEYFLKYSQVLHISSVLSKVLSWVWWHYLCLEYLQDKVVVTHMRSCIQVLVFIEYRSGTCTSPVSKTAFLGGCCPLCEQLSVPANIHAISIAHGRLFEATSDRVQLLSFQTINSLVLPTFRVSLQRDTCSYSVVD